MQRSAPKFGAQEKKFVTQGEVPTVHRKDILLLVTAKRRYDTRGILRNYRGEEVSDEERKRRRRKSRWLFQGLPHAAEQPQQPQFPELQPQEFSTHPSSPEAWQRAYVGCPTFGKAYAAARQAGDAGVKHEVAERRYQFSCVVTSCWH